MGDQISKGKVKILEQRRGSPAAWFLISDIGDRISANAGLKPFARRECAVVARALMLCKSLFDLGSELEGEGVQTLCQIANVLQKMVVSDEGRDGGE